MKNFKYLLAFSVENFFGEWQWMNIYAWCVTLNFPTLFGEHENHIHNIQHTHTHTLKKKQKLNALEFMMRKQNTMSIVI